MEGCGRVSGDSVTYTAVYVCVCARVSGPADSQAGCPLSFPPHCGVLGVTDVPAMSGSLTRSPGIGPSSQAHSANKLPHQRTAVFQGLQIFTAWLSVSGSKCRQRACRRGQGNGGLSKRQDQLLMQSCKDCLPLEPRPPSSSCPVWLPSSVTQAHRAAVVGIHHGALLLSLSVPEVSAHSWLETGPSPLQHSASGTFHR